MATSEENYTIDEFIELLTSILPVHKDGKYLGKHIDFSFAHPDTTVEFSPISLEQDLPGEVFQLSFEDCETECPRHEESLREGVEQLFMRLPDGSEGGLKICFRQFLFRKESFLNDDMSVKELIESIDNSSVKLNSRNVYMLDDHTGFLEILKKLGAVQKEEVKQTDQLTITLEDRPYMGTVELFFNPDTFKLSKVKQRRVFGKESCVPFPSPFGKKEKISDGMSIRPCANNKISFEDLCHKCSDTSLLTILSTPGLGALSKMENREKFILNRINPKYVPYIFLHHSRIKYTFDLDGVEVTLSFKSHVNHDFDGRVVSYVHQRTGREPYLKLRPKADQTTEHFASVVVRVLLALKKAVQDRQLRFVMFDVEEKSKRRYQEAVHQSPHWSLNSSTPQNSSMQPQKPQLSEELLEDIRRLRDEEDLHAMLGSDPNVHLVVLRLKAKSLIDKIGKIKPKTLKELKQSGFDLALLKQKLLDAASRRNLSL